MGSELLSDPEVVFSGYRVPHPLVHNFELKVRTVDVTTPTDALRKCLKKSINDVVDLEQQFQQEMQKFRPF